jgi:hypothetical protein
MIASFAGWVQWGRGRPPNGTQDLKDGTKYPPIPRANHLLTVRDYRHLEFSLLPSRLQENAEQALVAVTHCVATECGYELPSSDADCHLIRPGGHAQCDNDPGQMHARVTMVTV